MKTKPTQTTTTENLTPIFPSTKTSKELEEEAEKIGSGTGLIGDDKTLSKEQLGLQAEKERVKREAELQKEIEVAMAEQMNRQRKAMEDTMEEIRSGIVKKDGEK